MIIALGEHHENVQIELIQRLITTTTTMSNNYVHFLSILNHLLLFNPIPVLESPTLLVGLSYRYLATIH